MDEPMQQALQTAYQLIKSGQKEQAFALLVALIKENPNLAEAWYLLGHAVEDPSKRRYAFQQVLRIDPAHQGAQKQLTRLLKPPPTSPPPVSPARRAPQSAPRQKTATRAWLWLGAGLLLVGLVLVGALVVAHRVLPARAQPTLTAVQHRPTADPPTLTPLPTPSPTPPYAVEFRATACSFDVPLGWRVQCGLVKVPQSRTKDLNKQIEIPVVLYRSPKPNTELLVYLQGGPGSESIGWSQASFDGYVTSFLEEYDMLFFDPRGTGLSEPRLDCEGLNKIYIEMFFQMRAEEEAFQAFIDTWNICKQEFLSAGVDPADFNTAESAADVRDIVRVLGYEKVNLLGISYGTRLALTIMRDYPEIVRAVVIDSISPMRHSMFKDRAENVQYALDKMFSDCSNSPRCDSAYPDLKNKFNALIQRFDEQPVMVKNMDARIGYVFDMPVNGVDMLGAVVAGMHDSSLLPVIPKAIYDIEKGDYTFLSFALGGSGGSYNSLSFGTYFATACREQVYVTTPEAIEAALNAPPVIQKFALAAVFGDPQRIFQLCQAWGAQPYDQRDDQPVTSDLPTLILAGEYDPTTPVTAAEMVAGELPNNYFYVIPGMGHGATVGNDCATTLVKTFLREPTREPNSDCLQVEAAFEFFLPYDGHPVTFVPFDESRLRLSGLVPFGWRKPTIASIYYREAYGFDPTLVLFEALSVSQEISIRLIADGFIDNGFDEPPKKLETRSVKDLTWTIYSSKFNGEPVFLALTETSPYRTLALAMVVSALEREASYQGLFLPMLDGLTPR